MKTVKLKAQQGDVVFRKVDTVIYAASKIIDRGRCVLAHGESGHSHVVDDDEAELIQQGEAILLRLGKTATVTHEEHKPFRLEPGLWEIGRVCEWDYFSQMARTVQD